MHFQEIKDNYYKKIPEKIKEFIPEFISVFDEDDGIYPILSDLGVYFIDNVNNKGIIHKIMLFINDAITNGGYETFNAITLQVFNRFYEEIGNVKEIEQNLLSNNKLKLEKYFDKYKK